MAEVNAIEEIYHTGRSPDLQRGRFDFDLPLLARVVKSPNNLLLTVAGQSPIHTAFPILSVLRKQD